MPTVSYEKYSFSSSTAPFAHFCAGIQMYDVQPNYGMTVVDELPPQEQLAVYRGLLKGLRRGTFGSYPDDLTTNRMIWYAGNRHSPIYRMFTLMGCGVGTPFRNAETGNWVRTFQLLWRGRINPRPLTHDSWKLRYPIY